MRSTQVYQPTNQTKPNTDTSSNGAGIQQEVQQARAAGRAQGGAGDDAARSGAGRSRLVALRTPKLERPQGPARVRCCAV